MPLPASRKLRCLAGISLLLVSAAAIPLGAAESTDAALVDWEWPSSRPYPEPLLTFLPGEKRTILPKLAHYRTEPSHRPMYWYIDHMTEHRAYLFQGYWFIAASARDYVDGARIYDDDGELVYDAMDGKSTAIFDLCDYKGQHDKHICAQETRTRSYILDNTYRQVSPDYKNVGATNGLGSILDGHEFRTTRGGRSYIQQVIRYEKADLRPYLSTNPGWVETSSFVEADLSGKPFFSWNAFDHLDLWETTVFLNVKGQTNATSLLGGDGTDKDNPWDFCHMNAVSRDDEGFYYASARHLNSVLKIAGPQNHYGIKPGTIVWRLGGKKNDFRMINNFTFSKQHDVRHVASTAHGQVIALFDNAWEGFRFSVPTDSISSGKVIFVNNHTQTARLIAKFPHPRKKLSGSRGGFDILPNGNAIASWGHFHPELTEWTQNGSVLYHARYEYPDCQEVLGGCTHSYDFPFTYRGSKKEWHAWPYWKPKVVAYAYSCFAEATEPRVYASWNGATEIVAWRFSTADSRDGPWSTAISVKRHGFETNMVLPLDASGALPRYVKAQAVDSSGKILGHQIAQMFVPAKRIKDQCDIESCKRGFAYGDIDNDIQRCPKGKAGVPTHSSVESTPVASQNLVSPMPMAADGDESGLHLTQEHSNESHEEVIPVPTPSTAPAFPHAKQPTSIDVTIAITIFIVLGLTVFAGLLYRRRERGADVLPWKGGNRGYSELATNEDCDISGEGVERTSESTLVPKVKSWE